MSVSLIYTPDAFFFRFRYNSNADLSVNSNLHASIEYGSGLHVQNTMSAWLVCVGQSTTLLSEVYQLWYRYIVNNSKQFVEISVEDFLVSFLSCMLHCGNDLEDVRLEWPSLAVVKSGRSLHGSSFVEYVAPYLLTVLPTVDLWISKHLAWRFCILKPA